LFSLIYLLVFKRIEKKSGQQFCKEYCGET
jgi:hypothetical protein